jgi:hypothetical protein
MVPHGDIHQRVSLLCFHQPSILRSQSQPSRRSSASALRSSCGSVGEDPDETERSEEEEEGEVTKVLTLSFRFSFFFKTCCPCPCCRCCVEFCCVCCCWSDRLDLVVLGTLLPVTLLCVVAVAIAMGGRELEAEVTLVEEAAEEIGSFRCDGCC